MSCAACIPSSVSNDNYSLNITYLLGGDTDQTLLSFEVIIGSAKNDIDNIDAYEVLINTAYLDLILENGPYNSKYVDDYMQINGNILFDNNRNDQRGN